MSPLHAEGDFWERKKHSSGQRDKRFKESKAVAAAHERSGQRKNTVLAVNPARQIDLDVPPPDDALDDVPPPPFPESDLERNRSESANQKVDLDDMHSFNDMHILPPPLTDIELIAPPTLESAYEEAWMQPQCSNDNTNNSSNNNNNHNNNNNNHGEDYWHRKKKSATQRGKGRSQSQESAEALDRAGQRKHTILASHNPARTEAALHSVAAQGADLFDVPPPPSPPQQQQQVESPPPPPLSEPLPQNDNPWLQHAVLLICVLRFVVAYLVIFTDTTGGGEMFSYGGVLSLFRTKGDPWVVGIWMELCTLFIICAYWMLCDSRAVGISKWPLAGIMLVTFFIAGAGFSLYLVVRLCACAKQKRL